jgi:hypothetical protein
MIPTAYKLPAGRRTALKGRGITFNLIAIEIQSMTKSNGVRKTTQMAVLL